MLSHSKIPAVNSLGLGLATLVVEVSIRVILAATEHFPEEVRGTKSLSS